MSHGPRKTSQYREPVEYNDFYIPETRDSQGTLVEREKWHHSCAEREELDSFGSEAGDFSIEYYAANDEIVVELYNIASGVKSRIKFCPYCGKEPKRSAIL